MNDREYCLLPCEDAARIWPCFVLFWFWSTSGDTQGLLLDLHLGIALGKFKDLMLRDAEDQNKSGYVQGKQPTHYTRAPAWKSVLKIVISLSLGLQSLGTSISFSFLIGFSCMDPYHEIVNISFPLIVEKLLLGPTIV